MNKILTERTDNKSFLSSTIHDQVASVFNNIFLENKNCSFAFFFIVLLLLRGRMKHLN